MADQEKQRAASMGLTLEELNDLESMVDMDDRFMFGQPEEFDYPEVEQPEAEPDHQPGLRVGAGAWTPSAKVDVAETELTTTPEIERTKAEPTKEPPKVDMEKAAADMEALTVADEALYKQRLTVIQADPNSRLYAAKNFEDLNLTPELLKGVYEMGFDRPSRIQELALPMILAQEALNGIFQAQSGSGKTVAFVLGMLSKCDPALHECQALCVSPRRELAEQTMKVVEQMGKHAGLRFRRAMQGFEIERGSKVNEQVVVGTPGRVDSWIKKKIIDPSSFKVSSLQV
jgi:ATP-dependent RNA helicase DDX19/DBP5